MVRKQEDREGSSGGTLTGSGNLVTLSYLFTPQTSWGWAAFDIVWVGLTGFGSGRGRSSVRD